MSPSAVLRAVKNGKHGSMATAMEVIATSPDAKCSLRYALSAVKTPKYLLNPAVTDRFTVAIVIEKSDRLDNLV